jgi:hypothetical protein
MGRPSRKLSTNVKRWRSHRSLAPARLAAHPDLGTRSTLARICGRSPQAITRCRQESSRQGGSGFYRCDLQPWRNVKRGEIWTVAGGKNHLGKPRPVAIVQDDRFDLTDSVTVCAFTMDPIDAPLFWGSLRPNAVRSANPRCVATPLRNLYPG